MEKFSLWMVEKFSLINFSSKPPSYFVKPHLSLSPLYVEWIPEASEISNCARTQPEIKRIYFHIRNFLIIIRLSVSPETLIEFCRCFVFGRRERFR